MPHQCFALFSYGPLCVSNMSESCNSRGLRHCLNLDLSMFSRTSTLHSDERGVWTGAAIRLKNWGVTRRTMLHTRRCRTTAALDIGAYGASGVWCKEDMFPSPVGKGMGSWNFGLCTSNPVNFDAFWVLFLTVQPLAICAKTGAGTDPGSCVRGLVPPVPFVSLPISPLLLPLDRLEVGPLKHSTGSGGAVSSPSGVRGRTPAENEFGAL